MSDDTPKAEEKAQPASAPAQADAPGAVKAATLSVGKNARPKNCVQCNKTLKKKWYFRNGKYYCTKRCWKGTLKKKEEPTAAA